MECMEQVDRNVLWAEVETSSVYSVVVVWKWQSKGFKTALAARKLGGEERQCISNRIEALLMHVFCLFVVL